MITEFWIDNFKSLSDFRLSCHSLTCLIGINNSGKSTILQAIAFLSSIANGDVGSWLKAREWKASDIRSRFKGRSRTQTIPFSLSLEIDSKSYVWKGTFNLGSLSCTNESIERSITGQDNKTLLRVEKGYYSVNGENRKSIDFEYSGSIIASLKEQRLNLELQSIKDAIQSIKSLELLNPFLLRKRARTTDGDLGLGGEKLSAFLYTLPADKRTHILGQMKKLFEHFMAYHVKAKRSDWKELWIGEQFEKSLSNILVTEARHISDGFLRILALFSQLHTKHTVLLFDEIEDGLNHEVMEVLMDEMVKAPQQVIFTTHSPMILNFLDDDVAKKSVRLIYRESSTGNTQSCNFFDLPNVKERLEYMGPGEVFANVSLKELP